MHKCSSCTLYIALFSIIFTVNIGTGTYLVYYKYMNSDKEIGAKKKLFFMQQLLDKIPIKHIDGASQWNKH